MMECFDTENKSGAAEVRPKTQVSTRAETTSTLAPLLNEACVASSQPLRKQQLQSKFSSGSGEP